MADGAGALVVEAPSVEGGASFAGAGLNARAITKLQRTWRHERFRRGHDEHEFVKHLDPSTGYYYYLSRHDSSQATWQTPYGGVPLQAKHPPTRSSPRKKNRLGADTEMMMDETTQRPSESRRAEARREAEAVEARRAEARYERQHLIDMIREKHALEKRQRDDDDARRIRNAFEVLWGEAFKYARKSGELNLSDKRGGVLHPHVYEFQERFGRQLVALRLVRHDLRVLPAEVGRHCTALTALTLSSNRLTELPESICDCSQLRSLNVLRNQLRTLPARLGDLTRLDDLHVATNRLEALPVTFGNLTRLERVVLDCNCLRRLPETLAKLKCQTLSANRNCLVSIPRCVAQLTALTSLSVNFNQLKRIPNELGESTSLQELQLCSNALAELPESFPKLRPLRSLWLDHNRQMTALPWNFFLMQNLHDLRMEGCTSMVYPTQAKLVQGPAVVKDWFRRRQKRALYMRKHRIVTQFQDLMEQVVEARPRVTTDAFFQANVDYEGGQWYALIGDAFWNETLPALQDMWDDRRARMGRVMTWPYSRDQAEKVLAKYVDAESKVYHRRVPKMRFKRCGCVDATTGKRRVCVPPAPGWMCERPATLVKMHVVLTREMIEHDRQAREKISVDLTIDNAREAAMKYAKSKEGAEIFKLRALKQAKVEIEARRKAAFEKSQLDKYKEIVKRLDADLDRNSEVLRKRRDDHEARLYERLRHDLQPREAAAPAGYAKEKVEREIDAVLNTLARMPEDEELEQNVAKRDDLVDDAKDAVRDREYVPATAVQQLLERDWRRQERELADELEIDLVNRYCEKEMRAAEREIRAQHAKMNKITAAWAGLGIRAVFFAWRDHTRRELKRRGLDRWASKRNELQHHADCAAAIRLATIEAAKYEFVVDAWSDETRWRHRDSHNVVHSQPTFLDLLPAGLLKQIPPGLLGDEADQDRTLREQADAVRGITAYTDADLDRHSANKDEDEVSDQLSFMDSSEEGDSDDAEEAAEEVKEEEALVLPQQDSVTDSFAQTDERTDGDISSTTSESSDSEDDPELLEWKPDQAHFPAVDAVAATKATPWPSSSASSSRRSLSSRRSSPSPSPSQSRRGLLPPTPAAPGGQLVTALVEDSSSSSSSSSSSLPVSTPAQVLALEDSHAATVRQSQQANETEAALARARMRRKLKFHPAKPKPEAKKGLLRSKVDSLLKGSRQRLEVTHEDIEHTVGFAPDQEYTQAQLTKMAKQAVRLERRYGIDEPLDGAFEETAFDKVAKVWTGYRDKKKVEKDAKDARKEQRRQLRANRRADRAPAK